MAIKIKALISGFAPRKRKMTLKWVDTDILSLPIDALHSLADQQKIREQFKDWRDFTVKGFGEVETSETIVGDQTFVFEGFVKKQLIF